MPYNRKMPDWSIKVYHTEDEFYELFDKIWKEKAVEMLDEIRNSKKLNQNKLNEVKVLQYV